MAGEWYERQFGDCAVLVRETVSPGESAGVPYIGLEHIAEGGLSLLGYGTADDVTSIKSRFRAGDVLFGKLRPYFRKVIRAPFDGVCSTDIWVVRPRDDMDAGFLFYWMASRDFVDASMRGSEGTKMPRAKWDFVARISQVVPPLPEQRDIAHILGTLDDKIELNRRLNETLEAIARALFKSWFVDFDPVRRNMARNGRGQPSSGASRHPLPKVEGSEHRPSNSGGVSVGEGRIEELDALFPDSFEDSELGEIPKGWAVKPFVDTVEIIGGGTPKTSVPEYWNGDIPWFSVVDSPTGSDVWVVDTKKKITREGVENSSTQVLPVGTTIISARGTVGRIALVGVPMAMNQSCYGLRGKVDKRGFFTYFATRELVASLQQHAHGSVFDTITRDTLAGVSVALPPTALIEAFETRVSPTLERIRAALLGSRTLAALRDTLLPKLISGELRVRDAERFIAKVGL